MSTNIFVKFDEFVAQKCYDFMLRRNNWRGLLKLFEYLYHGIPWFLAVVLMYAYGDKFYSSLAVILFQGTTLI